jgi:hypothetical protein
MSSPRAARARPRAATAPGRAICSISQCPGAEGPQGTLFGPQLHRRRGAAGAEEAHRSLRGLCRIFGGRLQHDAHPGRGQRAGVG